MNLTVIVRDETATGSTLTQFEMVVDGLITLRELIRRRVLAEVCRYNADPAGRFQGLVRPLGAEVELNGYRPQRAVDGEEQAGIALAAFERNGFFVLLPGGQVEDLDALVDLTDGTEVVFVRLIPLVGG